MVVRPDQTQWISCRILNGFAPKLPFIRVSNATFKVVVTYGYRKFPIGLHPYKVIGLFNKVYTNKFIFYLVVTQVNLDSLNHILALTEAEVLRMNSTYLALKWFRTLVRITRLHGKNYCSRKRRIYLYIR